VPLRTVTVVRDLQQWQRDAVYVVRTRDPSGPSRHCVKGLLCCPLLSSGVGGGGQSRRRSGFPKVVVFVATQCIVVRLRIRIAPVGAVGMKGRASAHPKNGRL
jgi:hypothetical protein